MYKGNEEYYISDEEQGAQDNINTNKQSRQQSGRKFSDKIEYLDCGFRDVYTTSGIKDKKQKRVFLLYQAGSRVQEIFRQLTDTGSDENYDIAKA